MLARVEDDVVEDADAQRFARRAQAQGSLSLARLDRSTPWP